MKVKYQEYVYKIMEQFTVIMCNPKVRENDFCTKVIYVELFTKILFYVDESWICDRFGI